MDDAIEYAIIVFVVFLNAAAGAWRYLAEKLGWEAEALEFRDMGEPFKRAEAALAERWGQNGPHDEEEEKKAQDIVLELGRLALNEIEAWRKMRKERPLTPVAG